MTPVPEGFVRELSVTVAVIGDCGRCHWASQESMGYLGMHRAFYVQKKRAPKPIIWGLFRNSLEQIMVEAAGIEPASEDSPTSASTCVV